MAPVVSLQEGVLAGRFGLGFRVYGLRLRDLYTSSLMSADSEDQ